MSFKPGDVIWVPSSTTPNSNAGENKYWPAKVKLYPYIYIVHEANQSKRHLHDCPIQYHDRLTVFSLFIYRFLVDT